MVIQDKNVKVEFRIVGYQFPDSPHSKKNDFSYDANWLNIEIVYQNGIECNTYKDSCLLTYELKDTINDIQNLLTSKQTAFISEYMEPYLKFAVSKVDDKFNLILFFVYDTIDGEWLSFTVTETISREGLLSIKDELQSYLNQYPQK